MGTDESDEEGQDFDQFVFSKDSTEEFVHQIIFEEGFAPQVRFSCKLTGEFDLFTAYLATSLSDAPTNVEWLQGLGTARVSANSAVARNPGPTRVKRTSPTRFEAFVHLTVDRDEDPETVDALLEGAIGSYLGSAVVFGSYDILLELGAETRSELAAGLRQAKTVEGVAVAFPAGFAEFP